MAPRIVDPNARRIAIANAARNVILTKGFEKLRLKEIAAEMGCTTGVIQHYFRSKEALLLFAKTHLVDEKFRKMQAAAMRETGPHRLYALAMELMPLTAEDVEMYQVLCAFRGRAIGNRKLMDLQRRREEMGWQMFAKIAAELQAAGQLPKVLDPEHVAIGLMAFIEGLALPLAVGSRTPDAKTLTGLLKEYFEAVICPLGEAASRPARASRIA